MRGAAAFAAAGLALSLVTAARAARPLTPPAPDFLSETAWINARPLSLKLLRGRRVVLAAFINTANINSIRTFEVLKTWHGRYELNGLLIIGIHTPDYDFQRDPLAVRAAAKRFGLRFPLMLDNERKLWRAYANEGWPALYLIDHKGRIVHDRLGEGGGAEFEEEIRDALDRGGFDVPDIPSTVKDRPTRDCGEMTAEVSMGQRRGNAFSLDANAAPRTLILSVRDGEASYVGKWDMEPDALRLAQKNPDFNAFARIIYHGTQAFAVLAPSGAQDEFYVRQDGMWLHSGNAGKDVEFDDDGRSCVKVSQARLYNLTQNPNDLMHELSVMPKRAGSAVYGFSFSDGCLTTELP